MLTEEQKKLRRKGIGGSDVAAICNLSKWKTPLDVYLNKTLEGEGKEEAISKVQERGNILEPLLIEIFKKKFNKEVEIPKDTFFHPEYSFCLANIDGIIEGKEILEIKTSHFSRKNEFGEEGTDQIPLDYLLQVHHYLFVTGLEEATLAVIFEDEDFYDFLINLVNFVGIEKTCDLSKDYLDLKIFKIKKSEILEKELIKREKNFWEYVEKRTPPPLVNEDYKNDFFLNSIKGKKYKATAEDLIILEEIQKQKTIIEEAEKKTDHFKNILIKNLKDSEEIINDNDEVLATWKTQGRSSFNTKKLQEAHPELYQTYLEKTFNRTLRIKK